MQNFNYAQATRYLDDCLVFGIKPSLVRIKKILEIQGNNHKKTDFIHVVGTNGKTSTAIIASHIIYKHGLRCGYHISPHINEYTERLWACGASISKSRFARLFSGIYPYVQIVNDLNLDGPMTQFEIIAAMAFGLCAEEHLQVMILEAGMGGRWDATNVADSVVAGLTGVSLEHTAILGNTIEEIAAEKAQVIKEGAYVATTSNNRKVLEVLRKKTEKTYSKLFVLGKDFFILKKEKIDLTGWNVDIKGTISEYRSLKIPLVGNYQPANLSLALMLVELYFKKISKKVNEDLVKKALLSINVMGRFQIMQRNPLVIADTSHNPEGIKNFINNLNENFAGSKRIIIFAVLKDKNYKEMVADIVSASDILIITSSQTVRSLDVEILESEVVCLIEKLKKNKTSSIPEQVYKIDNIGNSLNFALNISKSNDIICITGSITNLEHINF
ncbi:MAG: Mur ligase family protein [Actinobacteria bacterium]|nr:Mur ligase family protein [Actinomycetota bacterium]